MRVIGSYTATQTTYSYDMNIGGQPRKVIMQAPKNGFFYVLDRTTGKLISAEPYTYMNWATGVDKATGRPIETDFSRYKNENVTISPGPNGGHNWHSMAYNSITKLVYHTRHKLIFITMDMTQHGSTIIEQRIFSVSNPGLQTRKDKSSPENMNRGQLLAWNPSTQKLVWKVDHPGSNIYQGVVNGGVMTSAGGLVFQGTAYGKFVAYDATDGKKLWEYNLGAGVIAPPITYTIDGKQYVSIAVGWGGAPPALWVRFTEDIYPGTIFTFALDTNESFAGFAKTKPKEFVHLPVSASKDQFK
jgi:quinohemoprotein ethanol dehydrogenase